MSKAIAQTNKDIDENLLLGYLFFYTLGDLQISESDLEDIFINNGLSTKFIRKISKVDAFRRATSSAKQSALVQYNGTTVKAKLEMDEVRCDNDYVVRTLGRKVIDTNNEELSYSTVGRVTYSRDNDSVSYHSDGYYQNEYNYMGVLEDVISKYDDWSVYHTKDTVRNICVHILSSMFPVNLMPSGLAKFIPKTSKDTLYSLQGVIRDLNAYGSDCLFEVIPVIDTQEQREMVGRTAVTEIKNDMQMLTSDLQKVIQTKQSLTSKTAANYVEKFKGLAAKTMEYEELLGSYMSILKRQLVEAMNLVNNNVDRDNYPQEKAV